MYPPPTTGLGVAARVVVNSSPVQLSSVGDTFTTIAPGVTEITVQYMDPVRGSLDTTVGVYAAPSRSQQ